MERPRFWSAMASIPLLLLVAVAASTLGLGSATLPLKHRSLRIPRFRPPTSSGALRNTVSQLGHIRQDLMSQCEERWVDATLDHFTRAKGPKGVTSFKQRYFLCAKHWGRDETGQLGPIFFYLGNEADVTLYLNASGLMWETAPSMKAALVFAEHRYYGKSLPFSAKHIRKHMQYLTVEQALADYAELIMGLHAEFNSSSAPVIGFGGSYGGMLAAWMRFKYPHLLDGAIAASAPIWSFEGEVPPMDPAFFSKGVTHDASAEGGAASACKANVRHGWDLLEHFGSFPVGRQIIAEAMSLCPSVKLETPEDVVQLRDWLGSAWDYMAMGNFPYPSSYILNGHGVLPAFPVRVACQQGLEVANITKIPLLKAMARAAAVYYNHTGDVPCFDFQESVDPDSQVDADFWSYQYCTECFMPFAKGGDAAADMFWEEAWDPDAVAAGCEQTWGVTPRRLWAQTEWGGRKIGTASNIAFSQGLLDPWHGGGVMQDINEQLPAIIIPEGAHHLDLMFSHPDDPQSVKNARSRQRALIAQWVAEARGQPAPSVKHTRIADLTIGGASKQVLRLSQGRVRGQAVVRRAAAR